MAFSTLQAVQRRADFDFVTSTSTPNPSTSAPNPAQLTQHQHSTAWTTSVWLSLTSTASPDIARAPLGSSNHLHCQDTQVHAPSRLRASPRLTRQRCGRRRGSGSSGAVSRTAQKPTRSIGGAVSISKCGSIAATKYCSAQRCGPLALAPGVLTSPLPQGGNFKSLSLTRRLATKSASTRTHCTHAKRHSRALKTFIAAIAEGRAGRPTEWGRYLPKARQPEARTARRESFKKRCQHQHQQGKGVPRGAGDAAARRRRSGETKSARRRPGSAKICTTHGEERPTDCEADGAFRALTCGGAWEHATAAETEGASNSRR